MKSLLLVTLIALPCFGASKAPYHQKADKIACILKREGARPNREAIALTLKAIDINLKKYFPQGPFTSHDFMAIAMLESRFNPKCVGTSGERGIFQIMPTWYKGKNAIKPHINTELAFKIMRSKYKQFPDKRLATIAYNGLIRRNGVVRDVYYRAVLKQKARIQHVS